MTQRYEDSAEQIKKGAARYLRRAHAAGARSVTLDDVISEMNVAWCIARDKFDPSLGVPFGAYLSRGMQLHVNRWIDEQVGHAIGAFSLDETSVADGDEAHEWAVPDANPLPDQILEEKHLWARAMSELSTEAALFVSLLREPPPALYEEMKAIQVRSEHARSRGIPSVSPSFITGNLVLDLMGLARSDRNRIYAELKELGRSMSRELTQ